MATTREKVEAATRAAWSSTTLDFTTSPVARFKTLAGPETWTFANPKLDKVIHVRLTGNFAVTLPGTVDVLNGDYAPSVGTNWAYIHCDDAAAPHYNLTWVQPV